MMRALGSLVAFLLAFNVVLAQNEKPDAKPDEQVPEAPQALVGKPAPDFKLDLLAGGQAKLSDHKGKDVVIIDFWATWCPPCAAELPLIDEIVKARADKDADKSVVFYAIDEEEEAADIELFLKKTNLSHLKIPLDKDGAVSKAYLVEGLPQAVIIGKDGVVKSVHVGLASKEDFAKAVDEALTEKKD